MHVIVAVSLVLLSKTFMGLVVVVVDVGSAVLVMLITAGCAMNAVGRCNTDQLKKRPNRRISTRCCWSSNRANPITSP